MMGKWRRERNEGEWGGGGTMEMMSCGWVDAFMVNGWVNNLWMTKAEMTAEDANENKMAAIGWSKLKDKRQYNIYFKSFC